jgi:hypothetical protein
MKSLSLWPIHLVLLSLLWGCGKNNESGKSSWNLPGIGTIQGLNALNIPQGTYLPQILAENPCTNGVGQQYANQRMPIRIPLTGFSTMVAAGDVFYGVTSYGDVAAVIGQAIGQPPLFVGYLCPRSFTQSGTGQLVGVDIGAKAPNCPVKPITRATVIFPGGASAEFRMLDGRTSRGVPFTFCRP